MTKEGIRWFRLSSGWVEDDSALVDENRIQTSPLTIYIHHERLTCALNDDLEGREWR